VSICVYARVQACAAEPQNPYQGLKSWLEHFTDEFIRNYYARSCGFWPPRPADAFRHIRIVATQSSESGLEAYYHTIEFYDEKSGLIKGGKATGSSPDAALAFDTSSDTKYRTQSNPGGVGDWIAVECPNPVVLNRLKVTQFGGASNHINAFNVSGSNDGMAWTLILSAWNVPVEFDSDREKLSGNVVWHVLPIVNETLKLTPPSPDTCYGASVVIETLSGRYLYSLGLV
jgi:hypothetical protein